MILKALNNNLIFDNEIADSSPTPVSVKTDTNDDSYLQNDKSTFTNWLRTPNTIDYRPHYKSPTNLDYYSKIRKIRNYQKVLSLFDKMVNNKMSMTSSEVMVEELTDKPKATKEYEQKKTTYSTRYYSTPPRRVLMIRKATQPSTTKRKTTTVTKQHDMIITKDKKCSCPKKLKMLLSKVVHSIQEVLPELTLMVKVPCNDSSISVTSGPNTISTTTPTTSRISSSLSEVSSTSIEDNDVTPTQSVTVSTVEPLTTINPKKYSRSYISHNKPKKHLEVHPNNNKFLGVHMQKLNIKPLIIKNMNSERRKNLHESPTKSSSIDNIDATEIFTDLKVFPTPIIPLTVSVTTTTTSPTSTTTTSTTTTTSATTTTTSATTTSATTTSAQKTNTPTKNNQNTKVSTTIETTTGADIEVEDEDVDYFLTTPQEEAKIFGSSALPQELSDFNPHILELIKSNILRSRPKTKKLALKEPNTYLDQVLENSSIQQTNIDEESKEDLDINTPEQPLPTTEENLQLENNKMGIDELILDSPDSINDHQQPSDDHQTVISFNDNLNLKDMYPTLPSFEPDLITSMLDKDIKKKSKIYIPDNPTTDFQETTNKYDYRSNTLQSPKRNNNFEINTSTVTSNSNKVVEQTLFLGSTTDKASVIDKDDTNNNILQEILSYEGLSRKRGKLKGNELIANNNLSKKTSSNDRKSSPLLNPKGETQKEVNNYMNWLENVGHPVNVMTSNWMASIASSSNSKKNGNNETPWYIKNKSTEYNEKSSMQTNDNNLRVLVDRIKNETQKVEASTWSYDLFNENNKAPFNCSDKDDKVEIEMPDSENLMPVQEIPFATYLGNSRLPEKLNTKIDNLPDEHFKFDDNSPSFTKSMIPHNRPIYLEIARRDWKKDVKDYDGSKETYTDIF